MTLLLVLAAVVIMVLAGDRQLQALMDHLESQPPHEGLEVEVESWQCSSPADRRPVDPSAHSPRSAAATHDDVQLTPDEVERFVGLYRDWRQR